MPSKCPNCGKQTLYHNEGVSKKTGEPYANNKCSACKFIEWEDLRSKTSSQPQNSPSNASLPQNGAVILLDEIKALNTRFDAMAEFLAKMDKKINELIDLAKG